MTALQIWLQNHNLRLTQEAIDEALMEYIAHIESELEAARKDAERYRWLRTSKPICDGKPFIARNFGASFSQWTFEHADKEIDAAIEQAKGAVR